MLADLTSIYLLSIIITSVVATLTLVIVARQTAHITKQTKLNTIISYYQYYKDVALAILQ